MSYRLENSKIDLAATRVIVISWPDGTWNSDLVKWIRLRWWKRTDHPDDQVIDVVRPDLICAKNWAIREHVIDHPGEYKHFLFIESDVRPDTVSDDIFRVHADVVCCQVKVKNDAAWRLPNSFHSTMWMSNRSALDRIGPPWFGVTYSDDGCDRLAGECEFFRARCLSLEMTIARGGYADHDMKGTWC